MAEIVFSLIRSACLRLMSHVVIRTLAPTGWWYRRLRMGRRRYGTSSWTVSELFLSFSSSWVSMSYQLLIIGYSMSSRVDASEIRSEFSLFSGTGKMLNNFWFWEFCSGELYWNGINSVVYPLEAIYISAEHPLKKRTESWWSMVYGRGWYYFCLEIRSHLGWPCWWYIYLLIMTTLFLPGIQAVILEVVSSVR